MTPHHPRPAHPVRRTALALAAAAGLLLTTQSLPAAADTPHPAAATDSTVTATDSTTTASVTTATAADYYASVEGKTGAALKSALHTLISDQDTVTYSQVWDALKKTDEDPANPDNIVELYTGKSIAKSRQGGAQGDWNREHVWAKSHGDFGTATGPGTDLHHLRPEDVAVNGARGNKDFDDGGGAVSGAPGNYTDSDSFEPRDAVKGDVARMILYMAVRYDGGDGFPDLEPNDEAGNGSAPAIGRLSVLKEWNEVDPPSSFEEHRNDVIFDSYQHNRNPFIDHPEWVESIW
ncbi:endonuclease [Streptomyces sp. DSM 41982]|uniref:Endonuclease n=1 Tax=Streptomyces evansiae TaxID=3075535 RepID=A0ABD5E356_9ACTN|nr:MULTISPECIES: endonuclease [unclassified Streptomyces]MDT0415421.1 endonuclease [Streptomyces sp. DSM 41982]